MSHPAPNSPAWRPDPSGRHAYRYFDGERWTEHVSDGQTRNIDRLPEHLPKLDPLDLLLPRGGGEIRFLHALAQRQHTATVFQHFAFGGMFLLGAAFVGVGLFGASWHIRFRAAAVGREATIARLRIESISADAPDAVPPGRLVHVKGVARAVGRVTDDQTGVSMDALVLARTVSMYQWVEACTYHNRRPTAFGRDVHVDDELRRATLRRIVQGDRVVRWSRCTYTKAWRDEEQTIRPDRVDRYGNPPFPFETGTHRFVPMRWALGKLELPYDDLPELPRDHLPPIPLAPEHLATLEPELRGRARIDGNMLYLGDPQAPKVGDVRYAYTGVTRLTLTLVGERTVGGLGPHRLPNGTEFFEVREGSFTVEQLAGARADDAGDAGWAAHAWFGAIVALGVALMFWPIRAWSRALPGPALVTGAGVLVFVPLMTAALYGTTLARNWWASDHERAVLAAFVAGGACALLLVASAVRLLLRAPENTPT